MEFYLVRHGEAVSQAVNGQRPLTQAGSLDVERVARAAAERGVRANEILHSGLLRAEQTAAILREFLDPTIGIRAISGMTPDDDPLILKAELEASTQSLVLVGHLPHLGRLAAYLAAGNPKSAPVEFAPATMVCFSYQGQRWKLLWKLTPASL